MWHDYVRKDAVKHWDDHTEANKSGRRGVNGICRARTRSSDCFRANQWMSSAWELSAPLRSLKSMPGFRCFAQGSGLHLTIGRASQSGSRCGLGAEEIYTWLVRIRLQANQFPADGWSDFSLWYIGVHDENQNEIYRRDLSQSELEPLSLQQPEIVLVCELQSGSIPPAWTVWPVSRSRGWLKKITGTLRDEDYTSPGRGRLSSDGLPDTKRVPPCGGTMVDVLGCRLLAE